MKKICPVIYSNTQYSYMNEKLSSVVLSTDTLGIISYCSQHYSNYITLITLHEMLIPILRLGKLRFREKD